MAKFAGTRLYGWYGEYQRDENGKCISCENLSFLDDEGELTPWAKGIRSISQYAGPPSYSTRDWSAERDRKARIGYAEYEPGGKYAGFPDELKPKKKDYLEIKQGLTSILELRCGTPYSILKKTNAEVIDVPGLVPVSLQDPDAGRVLECEDCPDVPDCIC